MRFDTKAGWTTMQKMYIIQIYNQRRSIAYTKLGIEIAYLYKIYNNKIECKCLKNKSEKNKIRDDIKLRKKNSITSSKCLEFNPKDQSTWTCTNYFRLNQTYHCPKIRQKNISYKEIIYWQA